MVGFQLHLKIYDIWMRRVRAGKNNPYCFKIKTVNIQNHVSDSVKSNEIIVPSEGSDIANRLRGRAAKQEVN